jgi:endonuclease G
VGFHFRDARVDDGVLRTIFLGPLGVKRLSPGFLLQAPDGTLRYDASTLGGSSGSPIVSLATGKVIGIHLSGTDDANLGITVKELQKKLASLTELLTK